MSLKSTKSNIFLIEVFKCIFDNRMILIKILIYVSAVIGEITTLFASTLSLSSKIYVHLSYFSGYIFSPPKLLFAVYLMLFLIYVM